MTDAPWLREELEQLALAGEGYDTLLRRLAAALGRTVRLLAVHGGLLATSEDRDELPPAASVPASGVPASDSAAGGLVPSAARAALACEDISRVRCTDGFDAAALSLRAGERRVGLLLVAEPVGPDEERAMRTAAVPLAIEAVRRDAEATARAESASRLVDELRFGSFRSTEQLVRAGQRFGLALERPHAAAVFAYDGRNTRAWSTAIRWIEMPVSEEDGLGWTVLAGDVKAELHRIRTRLEGIVGDGAVYAASGPSVSDPSATAWSFREAEAVLALLRARAGVVELPYDTLGLQALLLTVPPERLRLFVDDALGALADRPDLLATLEAWYDTNGSRAGVAARLGIHRNSVGYRIERIRALLGKDPLEPRTARRLQAALDAREVLEALDR